VGNWKGYAAYDIWFDPRPRTSGKDTGAEIMLWLDASRYGKPGGRKVRIDGAWWGFYEFRQHGRT
jgi:hypothetical protein